MREYFTFTAQQAQEVSASLAPPKLLKLTFKPLCQETSQSQSHVPHREHCGLSSSPHSAPHLHQAGAWLAGEDVLSAGETDTVSSSLLPHQLYVLTAVDAARTSSNQSGWRRSSALKAQSWAMAAAFPPPPLPQDTNMFTPVSLRLKTASPQHYTGE